MPIGSTWRRALCAATLVAALASASPVHAGWPLPAAGPSASGDPEVILTFDDGPHERFTSMVLDELARRDVQAIFFWVGRRLTGGRLVAQRRELVDRAVREGHLVANHTINHVHLCQVPPASAAHEIDENARILEELSGLPMILFRAPYGSHCRSLRALLEARALSHFHWDIDPQEWSDHDARRTAAYVIGKLSRLRGRAVVLMHDTHLSTVRALPIVLDWIDEENERREQSGRPPIRILSGSQLLAERLDPDLRRWATSTATRARSRLRALSVLIP
jgi:peptidoglycan-N-acetylglucosamine deacetylase